MAEDAETKPIATDRVTELERWVMLLAERLYACFEILARNAERKMTKRQKAIEQLAVDLFNAAVPVGSEVIFETDDGGRRQVKTRSVAWTLGHGAGVVALEGIGGGVCLSRVIMPDGFFRNGA